MFPKHERAGTWDLLGCNLELGFVQYLRQLSYLGTEYAKRRFEARHVCLIEDKRLPTIICLVVKVFLENLSADCTGLFTFSMVENCIEWETCNLSDREWVESMIQVMHNNEE
jgi:hypothetical protein